MAAANDAEGGEQQQPQPQQAEDFEFDECWTVSTSRSHILPSQCATPQQCEAQRRLSRGSDDDDRGGGCCDYCVYTAELRLPHLPEMVFPRNVLRLRHRSGFAVEFNALDALRGVTVGATPEAQRLRVACADDWRSSRSGNGGADQPLRPFDWTFSSEYGGTLSGAHRLEATDERIDVEKLRRREPIRCFREVILFEDELHDNGVALSAVKFRAMPSGFFVLHRFFLRVDGVLVRAVDTRMHYEPEKGGYVLRERSFREAKFDEVAHPEVAASADPSPYLHLLPVKYAVTEKLWPTEDAAGSPQG